MKQGSQSSSKSHRWQMVGATLVAALFTAVLVLQRNLTGSGLASDDPAEQAGYLLGTGIGIAVIVWLIGYLLVFRKSTRSGKWLSFLVTALSGTAAAFV